MQKLFIGIKGHIICLNKETGKSIWTTKLKSSSSVTNVHFEGKYLFASTKGHLYCLSPEDGSIKWTNPLNGFGNGPCIIATENQALTTIATAAEAQQNSAVATVLLPAAASSAGDQS